MRPIERIPRILKLLEKLWKQHPDQRFGQLLINQEIIADEIEAWAREDDLLESRLRLAIK